MANRYLSMLNILFHLRCNKTHGSSQFGQMIDFYACVSLFAIWKLHLETQVQTGARNRADTRASGVWPLISVSQTVFHHAWLPDSEAEERQLLLLGTNLSEATGYHSGMATGSQRFIVHLTRVTHPVRPPWPNCQEASPASFPWELELIVQSWHCRSIWSQEPFLPWLLKACEAVPWCSLDSDPCLTRSPSSFLSSSETPRCTLPGWVPDACCGQFFHSWLYCPESTMFYWYRMDKCPY